MFIKGLSCSLPDTCLPSHPSTHSGSKGIDCPCLTLALAWDFDMQLLSMLWLSLVMFAGIGIHILFSFVCHEALPCLVLAHLLQPCPYSAQLSPFIYLCPWFVSLPTGQMPIPNFTHIFSCLRWYSLDHLPAIPWSEPCNTLSLIWFLARLNEKWAKFLTGCVQFAGRRMMFQPFWWKFIHPVVLGR